MVGFCEFFVFLFWTVVVVVVVDWGLEFRCLVAEFGICDVWDLGSRVWCGELSFLDLSDYGGIAI